MTSTASAHAIARGDLRRFEIEGDIVWCRLHKRDEGTRGFGSAQATAIVSLVSVTDFRFVASAPDDLDIECVIVCRFAGRASRRPSSAHASPGVDIVAKGVHVVGENGAAVRDQAAFALRDLRCAHFNIGEGDSTGIEAGREAHTEKASHGNRRLAGAEDSGEKAEVARDDSRIDDCDFAQGNRGIAQFDKGLRCAWERTRIVPVRNDGYGNLGIERGGVNHLPNGVATRKREVAGANEDAPGGAPKAFNASSEAFDWRTFVFGPHVGECRRIANLARTDDANTVDVRRFREGLQDLVDDRSSTDWNETLNLRLRRRGIWPTDATACQHDRIQDVVSSAHDRLLGATHLLVTRFG